MFYLTFPTFNLERYSKFLFSSLQTGHFLASSGHQSAVKHYWSRMLSSCLRKVSLLLSLSVLPPNLEVFLGWVFSFSLFSSSISILSLCWSTVICAWEVNNRNRVALSPDLILSHSPDALKCLHNLFSSSKVVSETISMCLRSTSLPELQMKSCCWIVCTWWLCYVAQYFICSIRLWK